MHQKKIPMRMCTGCGEMKPKKELVRVVKAPQKEDESGSPLPPEISLDLTGKKPGRGAYLCRNPECLRLARKARRLERAFSCKIPDEVWKERFHRVVTKLLSMLGLARRAGKLESGFDAAVIAAREGKAALLLAARDISEKTFQNLRYEAEKAGIPVVRIPADIEETSRACGRKAGVHALTDRGFAKAVLSMVEDGKREKEECVL